MKTQQKWSPDVGEFMHATANALLDSISGTDTHIADVAASLKVAMLTQFDNDELLGDVLDQACLSLVDTHVNAKSQDKQSQEQGDWLEDNFGDGYLKSLLKLDGGFLCHHEDAHWDMLVSRRDRQKKHEEEARAKRKKSDTRLELLASVGMDSDPEMTVKQAVRLLAEMKGSKK